MHCKATATDPTEYRELPGKQPPLQWGISAIGSHLQAQTGFRGNFRYSTI